jgi:periplasmic copper chaperone A
MNPMKSLLAALAVTLAMPMTAFAGDAVAIVDPYARVSGASATSGAAFMVIENHTDVDDRLIGAASDVAQRVELHTHIQDANGVMQMRQVEDGFVVPAHGAHALARGGDHVMFLGLTRSLSDGDLVTLTLTFEKAGEVVATVPVDLNRKPMTGMMGGTMNHGAMAPAAGN